jgi:protein-arginine kinase
MGYLGKHCDWPTGRAVFISNSNNVVINVNNIDHLTISFKMELQEKGLPYAFSRFKDLIDQMQQHLQFSFD